MWLNWLNLINSVLIYVGKAMKDEVPRGYGKMPMEDGLYANVVGKRTLLGLLIAWFVGFKFSSYFFKAI